MSKAVPGMEGMVALDVKDALAPGRLYWVVGKWPIGSVPNTHLLCESFRGNYKTNCTPYEGGDYTDELTAERGYAYVFIRPDPAGPKLVAAHAFKILLAFQATKGGVFAGGPIDDIEDGPVQWAAEVFSAMSDSTEDFVDAGGNLVTDTGSVLKWVGYGLLGVAVLWAGVKVFEVVSRTRASRKATGGK